MCKVMEFYNKEAVQKERAEKIQKMILKKYSKEDILDLGYTEAEYEEVEKTLLMQ